jgi:hypothetical protein
MQIDGQGVYVHDCAFLMDGVHDAGTPGGAIHVGSAVHGGLIENCSITFGTDTADGTTNGIKFAFNNERWKIKNCDFHKWAVQNDESMILLGEGTALGLGNALEVENCKFMQYNTGTAMDEAIGGTAMKLSFGLAKDCSAVGCTALHSSDGLIYITPSFAGGTINNLLQNPGLGIPGTALVVTKT